MDGLAAAQRQYDRQEPADDEEELSEEEAREAYRDKFEND